jgi:serine/threonine-protein kinase
MARGSAGQFSATSDPLQIGVRLGVDAVLVTHLERRGDLTGLRAQLVSTRDGSMLWTFSVPPNEAGLDDEQVRHLARSVAKRLWATLQLREPHRAVDSSAYQFYLRGRYYWNQRSPAALLAAVQAFEAALAIEPDYVDALLGLADSWLVMPNYAGMPPQECIPKARALAERALELDSGAAHALAVLGVITMQYDWDWTTAENYLRQALTLNPNDATAEQWLGELYCYRMRPELCRKHLHAASGLDPLSPVLQMMQGSPALFSGDFESAVRAYSRALEEVPEFPFAHYVLGLAYAGLGDWDSAVANYDASLPRLGLEIVGGPLIYALARRGDSDRAETLLVELERLAETRYVPATKFATAWLGKGDRRRALEWLERALDDRDDRLVYLAVDAHFVELHDDPTFQSYAGRVGVEDVLKDWNSGLPPETGSSPKPTETH